MVLRTVIWVAESFGVPLAPEKTEGPCTSLSFLGIVIDSINWEFRLPEEKVVGLRSEVARARRLKKLPLLLERPLLMHPMILFALAAAAWHWLLQDIVPVYQIKGISKLVKLCLPKVQCFCDSLTSPPSERQFNALLMSVASLRSNVFFSNPHIWEKSRYILFVHMLINDTLYLALGNFLLLSTIYSLSLPVPVCFMLQTLATCSFRVTPYNLAVMSLERYVAICFPLRHLEFCTAKKARSMILVIWVIGVCPSIADLTVIMYSIEKSFLSLYVACDVPLLALTPQQNVIKSIINFFSFTMVALIIAFTYIKIMLVARKIGSVGSSALKARKTVMLHAFQLILCLVSFISTITETVFIKYISYLLISNFLIFTCLLGKVKSLPKLEDRWVQPGPAAWKASPNQGFKLEEANLHIPGAFWEKRRVSLS
ncbi:unnamed protein product [Ranitomeya imitator]|uniref:G-protein coupled receptors family 1 profile domain-containing protein n=1 Tax=Ranitomeya imitator TaxID=111125 RepID=A0ABN9MJN5_9NEOB|nr:unnamed protein product [Ranitomeya imitator]